MKRAIKLSVQNSMHSRASSQPPLSLRPRPKGGALPFFMDSEQTIFMTQPKGLARILSLDDQEKELWNAQEIEAMWRHQLSAPLGIDLETVVSVTATQLRKAPQFDSYRNRSFSALFADPQPPIE